MRLHALDCFQLNVNVNIETAISWIQLSTVRTFFCVAFVYK